MNPNNVEELGEAKPLPGSKHYMVTTTGHIYSKQYRYMCKGVMCIRQPRMVTETPTNGGIMVNLRTRAPGKHKRFMLARLVLLTYVGPPEGIDWQAHHINGDKMDNRPSNLTWAIRTGYNVFTPVEKKEQE